MKHLFELFRMPEGIDLERVHLLGDFSVDTVPEPTLAAGTVRLANSFMIKPPQSLGKGADLTSSGYPFYPAPVEYRISFNVSADMLNCKRILLRIGHYHGCSATVSLKEKRLGFIDREPYTLEIEKGLLQEGENEMTIKLLGSFRNMFGPSHMLGYDPSFCSRLTWYKDYEYTDCTAYDKGYLTNSFQLIPYGISDIELEFHL